MRFAGDILTVAVLLAYALPGMAAPGEHDEEAVRLLRTMDKVLPLRTTKLKDLAPEYVVEKNEGLGWAEAVAEAQTRYGSRQPGRAVFLSKYLVKGASPACLGDLQLPEAGYSTGTGSGWSKSFLFGPVVELTGRTGLLISPVEKPVARITVWISGDGVLVGDAAFELMNFQTGGMTFDFISFDAAERVSGWNSQSRLTVPGKGNRSLGANLSGDAGVSHYWAWFTAEDGDSEMITFTPELIIKERRVTIKGPAAEPKSIAKNYCETYQNGSLKKRLHYGERHTKDGTETIVVREEKFK